MKKFRDYYPTDITEITMSMIDIPLTTALADGIKALEVSKKEYAYLIRYFGSHLPWNWSGKSIWGIRLVIKEPNCEHEVEDIPEDPSKGAICKKCGERIYKPYTSQL